MTNHCELIKRSFLCRNIKDRGVQMPEEFLNAPLFRCGLLNSPTTDEWERLSKWAKAQNGCVLYEKDRVHFRGKMYRTKRLFYEWFVDELPKKKTIHTTCQHPNCIYPEHMKSIEKSEIRYKINKIIMDNKHMKKSLKEIAKELNISRTSLYRIRKSRHGIDQTTET